MMKAQILLVAVMVFASLGYAQVDVSATSAEVKVEATATAEVAAPVSASAAGAAAETVPVKVPVSVSGASPAVEGASVPVAPPVTVSVPATTSVVVPAPPTPTPVPVVAPAPVVNAAPVVEPTPVQSDTSQVPVQSRPRKVRRVVYEDEDEVPDAKFANLGKWHVSLYGLYNMANTWSFDSLTASGSGGSGSGSLTYNVDSGVGLGIQAWKSDPNSWGMSFGFEYDFPRNINSQTVTLNGTTYIGVTSGSKPTVTEHVVYLNAIYRWNDFYLPFGLNYSMPTLQGSVEDTITITGAIGIQVGVGTHVTDHFSVEALVQTLGTKMTESNSTTYIDYGTGYLTGAQLNLKFDY